MNKHAPDDKMRPMPLFQKVIFLCITVGVCLLMITAIFGVYLEQRENDMFQPLPYPEQPTTNMFVPTMIENICDNNVHAKWDAMCEEYVEPVTTEMLEALTREQMIQLLDYVFNSETINNDR